MLRFDTPAAEACFLDYRGGGRGPLAPTRRARSPDRGLVATSPWAREVGRLRCLRGIDTLSAVGLCAEVGDFARFGKAGQLTRPRALGELVRRDSPPGRDHQVRLPARAPPLVEAAWHYRNPPRVGREIERRQAGQPAAAVAGGMVGAAAPAPHLLADAEAQQAGDRDHGRSCPRARQLLLGDRPDRVRSLHRQRLEGRRGRPSREGSAVQL